MKRMRNRGIARVIEEDGAAYDSRTREAETGGENGVEKERTRETSASDAERREGAP